MKIVKKIVAMLAVALMLMSVIPFSAMAAESTSATITFDDKAKRTEFDTSHQVWVENGITVTNNKGASTSNVADYAKPARFYKNSDLIVEYPGMTKIDFNCNTASYATALAGAIDGAAVNDKVVSVALNGVDSFTCTMSGGQVRVDSITVYTGEAGDAPVEPPVTPDEPEVPSGDPEADTELSISDAIALGASKEHNAYTEGKYYVTGVITEVYNTQYGNMKIQDEAGNILTIYGTYSADGEIRYDALEVKPVAGDTVKIYGIIGQYNGTPQVKNGWIVEHIANETPVEPPVTPDEPEVPSGDPAADTELSISDAIALGTSKEHNTYTEGKYYVTGVITEVYNTQYGNMKIKDEAGNILTIYGTYSADGSARYDAMEVKPVAGDTVKIYGIIGQYNGTPQVKNGWIVEHTANETPVEPPVTPDEPDEPSTDLVLIDTPVAGVAYKFGMIQGNVSATDVYYLIGGMNGYYMATGTDAAAAIDVYLEATEGGYYLYTADEKGTKTYINMVVSGTHVNGAYEASPSTVYTYDADAKTVIATVNDAPYWFGTRNDKTYTTVGPCATSYEGFYCQFYAAGEVAECEHAYDNACDADCNLCGEIREVSDHVYDDEYDADCNVCGAIREVPEKPVDPDVPAVGGGSADFNTIQLPASKPNGDSSYTATYTTANGWVTEYSAIQCGGSTVLNPQFPVIGADNTSKAVCLNGKVSAPGKITSPTLTGGISKLTINYTKMFTDTKLSATVTITDLTTGAVYTHTIAKEADKNTKYEIWTDEWVLETPITGDFTIVMVNDCPSAATSNKDRMTILDLSWEGAASSEEPEVPACNHEYDNACDVDCNLCGETREVSHTVKHVEAKVAVCGVNGNIEYWYCEICGAAWLDEACTLNTNLKAVILPMGHGTIEHVEAKDATCAELGNIEYWYCKDCGQAWLDEACTLNTNLKAVVLPTIDHTYDNAYDANCNVCGGVREVPQLPYISSGSSVSEDVSGLASKFDLTVEGIAIKDNTYNQADFTNATFGGHKLLGLGVIASNGTSSVDIKGVHMCALDGNSASFAFRVVNIPADKLDVEITMTPYFIVEIDGVVTTVYGEPQVGSYNSVSL